MMWGNELSNLCIEAKQEVLLVAPFIKASILERLIDNISPDVSLRCITRWFPEEIVAGVSDLEVWNLVQNRPNSSLWLRPDLHAKYYRADARCFVGSANLTGKALGWSYSPNLELLVALSADEPMARAFETELLKACIPVTEDLFEQMSIAVNLLAEQALDAISHDSFQVEILENNSTIDNLVDVNVWLPILRNPEDLYLAYSEQTEKLSTVSKIAALTDLRSLSIIPNLSPKVFKAYVGTLLLQKPIIQKIDSFVNTPRKFGAVIPICVLKRNSQMGKVSHGFKLFGNGIEKVKTFAEGIDDFLQG
ncbi:MAG: phospholipase D family protein, partial [Waterburya sp.]